MKKIEAVIREEQLPIVRQALEEVGYPGITITGVRGHGRQKGITQQWRGREFTVDLLPKVKLELIVADADATKIIDTIAEHARTGNVGDGKIWAWDIETIVRVRTGEKGEVAI
ncbi:MAG TPA: P-II family nitrogen regulator [Dehalococcoidia bacterium]|nr:P-II family nitrogen regulator [Dehalococcoidia bacterium]